MAARCSLRQAQRFDCSTRVCSLQTPIRRSLHFSFAPRNGIEAKPLNQLKPKTNFQVKYNRNNFAAANGFPFGTPSDPLKKTLRKRRDLDFKAKKTPHEVIESLLRLRNNFLPLALLSATLAGLLWPTTGQIAQQWGLSKWAVFSIFLISGLTLQDGELEKALEAWPLGLFGLVSILLLTPMAAYILLQLRLQPSELVTGLAIFCCVPTTLSSGVSLTQLVGANATLALALTVISNLLGIFTMPIMLSMLFSRGIGVSIPVRPLLSNLLQTLLLPFCIGKGIQRSSSAVQSFVDKSRGNFSILSSALLSLVPWMQVSSSRSILLQTKLASLITSFSLGMALHVLFLACNSVATKVLCHYLGNKDGDKTSTRAVILVASQKTLPVTVAVVENLGGTLGIAGLLVLPCVAAHLIQILIDAVLVNIWIQQDKKHGSEANKLHSTSL